MAEAALSVDALFGVAGKTALVTGGSSGVGLMIATVLAANGVRTYITGRNPDRLAEAAGSIGAVPIAAPLSDIAAVDALAAEIAGREARLNILVNNAGASWGAPIETYPETGWDRVMDLNVKMPFYLAQRLLPLLSAPADDEDWGRVINISSVAARTVSDVSVAYHASKAAIEHLTRIMARGFARHRVTANGIAPGWFPSRMNAPLSDADRDTWIAATPHGRLGTTEDIGGLALFLCGRAGVYLNGQILTLDGGRTL